MLSIVADKAPTAADKVPTGIIDDEIEVGAFNFCSSIICCRAKVIRFRIVSRPERTQPDKAERNTFISAASYLKINYSSFSL
jgi:hypothetical protein